MNSSNAPRLSQTIEMDSQYLLFRLRQQLQQFGLDPKEWNLLFKGPSSRRNQFQVELIHSLDHDYRFIGYAQVMPLGPSFRASAASTSIYWIELKSLDKE